MPPAVLRPVLRHLSPAGPRARLSILIFHRVLPEVDPLFPGEPDAARFDTVCAWLAAWFNVVPLDDAVRRLADGTLPDRALAITFDDGYADNHDVALPILQRHGLPATFFVATGFLDGGRMWNDTAIEALRGAPGDAIDLSPLGIEGVGRVPLADTAARRRAIDDLLPRIKYRPLAEREALVRRLADIARTPLPDDLMMTGEQVRALHRAGMQVGAHTVSHPILATLDDASALAEISASKTMLETLIDAPVTLFAYPNGRPGQDFTDASVALARRAGFAASVTTAKGAADAGTDLHRLPRYTPWERSRLRFGLRLAQNLHAG